MISLTGDTPTARVRVRACAVGPSSKLGEQADTRRPDGAGGVRYACYEI